MKLRSDGRVKKGQYMDAEILKLYELKKISEKWGLRNLVIPSDKPKLLSPLIAWYQSGAHSRSHYHAKSEGIYYLHHIGPGVNKSRITIGWPPEKAKIYEVNKPTMIIIPPGVKHRIDNTGTSSMILIECYAPSRKETGFDVVDSETGRVFNSPEEYKATYPDKKKK